MAKAETAAVPAKPKKYDDWEVRDAMRTLMRAEEINGDAKLMKLVKKEAAKEATKMQEVARQADRLARSGHISEKQLAKLKKKTPIASGSEGDKGGAPRGISAK